LACNTTSYAPKGLDMAEAYLHCSTPHVTNWRHQGWIHQQNYILPTR